MFYFFLELLNEQFLKEHNLLFVGYQYHAMFSFMIQSTIQNILLRYGINNRLNFILPPKEYQNQLFSDDPEVSGRRAQRFTVRLSSLRKIKLNTVWCM